MTAPVAVGIRDHTGWAVAVALGPGPAVVDRRRLQLLDDSLPRQPYHAAQDLPLDEAADLVARVEAAALEAATDALRALCAGLGRPVAAVAVGPAPRVPDSLERILASHTLLHAAEGALYREAIAEAAAGLGLPVVRFDLKTVLGEVDVDLAALGRGLGPPWQKDHREAAAGALLADVL